MDRATMFRKSLITAMWVGMLFSTLALGTAAGVDVRLVDAAMHSDRESLRTLVQQKVDINSTQPDGTTALHWVVQHDDLESAQLLIRSGAKVNAVTRYGVTPLYLACVTGNAAMIEALVKAGADPKSAN